MKAWIIGGLVTVTAHVAFAAWVGLREPAPRPTYRRVEMDLAAVPPPKPVEQPTPPPPKPVEPPKPQPKPMPVIKHVAPKPVAAPPPPAPKIGVTETADKGEVAVPTGVSTDGVIGTGTSADPTPAPPAPPPPPPAPVAPKAPRVFKAFEVTRVPKATHAVAPVIPDAFKQAQREAVVVVEVVIDARGHVVDARVLRHAEFGLDDAALAAAKQTEFEPALVGDEPVSVRYQIPYRFKVKS